jgi:hypothetical protein
VGATPTWGINYFYYSYDSESVSSNVQEQILAQLKTLENKVDLLEKQGRSFDIPPPPPYNPPYNQHRFDAGRPILGTPIMNEYFDPGFVQTGIPIRPNHFFKETDAPKFTVEDPIIAYLLTKEYSEDKRARERKSRTDNLLNMLENALGPMIVAYLNRQSQQQGQGPTEERTKPKRKTGKL